jgi:RNA polymerase sigma-70 factor (ECF subfamily)
MSEVERIWKEYGNNLRHFIEKRVSDKSALDDILQDVFIKIHSGIDKLEDSSRIQSWLYQIARNTIIDYYRTRRITEELPEEIGYEANDNDVMGELSECLGPMIQALPETYKEAVELFELEGIDQEQIADRLGLSLSGAKSRVQRGRRKLKEMLLDCCHFEFDRRGSVIDFVPQKGYCKNC